MRWSLVPLPLVVACSSPRPATLPAAHPSTASQAWTALQRTLPGRWVATTGTTQIPVTFQLIANGTAILETFGNPDRPTAVVYHQDGACLVATHYCAQGNQPRLRTCAGDPDRPLLHLTDVTDRDPDEAVLVELGFDLGDANAVTRTEDYEQPGGAHERTTFRLARVNAADAP